MSRGLLIGFSLVLAGLVYGQDDVGPMEVIEVVGTTPLGGKLDTDKIPSNAQIATSEQIREQHSLDLADFMKRNLASVFVNEAQSNPLQPDIQYRGFVGSPLLGMPQGIAVYQDGVRINEPFGDTVNWALIPQSAIETVYLMPGSNPLFGLNALGGAISIETKDGFAHPGTRAEVYAGSFSRVGVQAETGGHRGDRFSYFVTGSYLEEDGWRDFSPTEASQLFANLGWQSERTSIDANLTYADTDLIGNGPAPVELLNLDRSAIFTRPDQTRNELTLMNVTADHTFSDTMTLSGNVYARNSDVNSLNGDDSNFEECENSPGFLCEGEELVLDPAGDPIPAGDSVEGAAINRTNTEQDGVGFGLQGVWSGDLAGRDNQLIVGLAYDESDIAFDASTELGALDSTRLAVPSGLFVGELFTRLKADTSSTGIYVSDIFSLSEKLVLTASGRYNRVEVTLRDQLGTALNGDHEFERFNPALGLTYRIADNITFYAGYNESNRAPSPVELTCADEDDPCRLPNAFLADPPLEQVIAQTIELGMRGDWASGSWHAGVFRTTNDDDILFISAGALTNEGFFDNVGSTRRNGVELSLDGATERLSWFGSYTYLDATFQSTFAVPSPNNPEAVDGEILVESGDRLPLIPSQLFKAGIRVSVTPRFSIGGQLLASAGQHLRGDEGNLVDKIDSYALVSLNAEYHLNDNTRIFINIDNVLDEEFETFGVFGQPEDVLGSEFVDSRFLSPGTPRAAWLGVSVEF